MTDEAERAERWRYSHEGTLVGQFGFVVLGAIMVLLALFSGEDLPASNRGSLLLLAVGCLILASLCRSYRRYLRGKLREYRANRTGYRSW